jgi:hypothetical protein
MSVKTKRKLYILTLTKKVTLEMNVSYSLISGRTPFEPVATYQYAEFEKVTPPRTEKDDEAQIKYRNRLLDLVPDGEFMLILDSDEIIGGDLTKLEKGLDFMEKGKHLVANIIECNAIGEQPLRPRLIIKKEGMEYKNRHDQIWYKGKNILLSMLDFYFIQFMHYKEYPIEFAIAKVPDGKERFDVPKQVKTV